MKLIVFFLMFILCSVLVFGAPRFKDVHLKVDLSRSGGSTYGTKVEKTIACGFGDSQYVYVLDTTNWIGGSTSNTNFRARVECDAIHQMGLCQVDLFETSMSYTVEATINFTDPTPANASHITGYQLINASSDLVLTDCYISHNSSGVWVNRSGTLWADGLGCWAELYDLVNDTDTYYSIYGYTSTWSFPNFWYAHVNSSVPTITVHDPDPDEEFTAFSVLINWSYQDFDDDYSMQKVYIDRGDDNIPNLVYRSFDKNGTYDFTFDGNLSYINTSDSSLYGYWKMDADEGFGSLLYNNRLDSQEHYPLEYDYSGNNRHATYDSGFSAKNANYTEDGFISGAYDFDGTGDFLVVENETEGGDLYQDTGFAASAWVYTRDEINIGIDMIVSKYTPTDFRRYWYLSISSSFPTNTSNRPFFIVYSDGDTSITGCFASAGSPADTVILAKDTWHHLVGIYNRTANQTHLYANGELIDSTNCSSTFNNLMNDTAWTTRLNDDDGHRTFIGRSGASNHFNGLIDEIAIWNRSLSEGEVLSLYNATYGEYFYNVTATDWRVNVTGNFSIAPPAVGCVCDSTGCLIENEECLFTDNADLQGQNITCINSNVTWLANITNAGTDPQFIDGCIWDHHYSYLESW